jgi:hypothetical protein
MLIKIKLIIISIAVSSLIFTGCSTKELIKYSDDNSCITTIEGNYFKELKPGYDYPVIFLKMEKYPKRIKGELIIVKEDGIIFDPDNIGFYDEDETFFSFDTLYGVVNSAGKLIYGAVPEFYDAPPIRHKLIMELTKKETEDKTKLVLQPNEPFAYCINPGEYIVSVINFAIEENKLQDTGYDLPIINLTVEEGKANYLGNIYVDYKTKDDKNALVIPCKNEDAGASFTAGFLGGVIGSVAYAIANDISSSGLHHVIHIERDKNFLPEADKQIVEVDFKINNEKTD